MCVHFQGSTLSYKSTMSKYFLSLCFLAFTVAVYLAALIVCLPVLAGSAAVLVIVICCCRRKRKTPYKIMHIYIYIYILYIIMHDHDVLYKLLPGLNI